MKVEQETKFTPGPWTHDIKDREAMILSGAEEGPHENAKGTNPFLENSVRHRVIATLSGSDDATKVNARLIAAAPCLYDALESLLSEIETAPGHSDAAQVTIEECRRAIVKAKGVT